MVAVAFHGVAVAFPWEEEACLGVLEEGACQGGGRPSSQEGGACRVEGPVAEDLLGVAACRLGDHHPGEAGEACLEEGPLAEAACRGEAPLEEVAAPRQQAQMDPSHPGLGPP